jgi:3',5'-cyclic AMP phosphodiesterase CpdA
VDGEHAPHVFRAVVGAAELRPGTRYEYEVRHGHDGRTRVLPASSFTTPPGGREAVVTFAFVADTGIAGRADGLCDGAGRMIDEIATLAPDVVLFGGDLAYRSSDSRLLTPGAGVRAWLDQLAPIATRLPVMVQYGNHETELGERFRDWAAHLTQPDGVGGGRCYSFALGGCHIVGFFAPTDVVEPAAVAWLEADLAAARSRGARWLVVFQHQPLFAHGAVHPASTRLRAALGPTLERHRVDLHLSAHDQNLERTYPLRDVAAAAPVIASTSRRDYQQGDGVVYGKVGPGGKRSDRGGDFSRLPDRLPPYVAVADDTRHHFALVRASPSQLRVQVHGFARPDSPLELVDRFTISAPDAVATSEPDPGGHLS